MSLLRDEEYENLDYLSQLTEIVVSPHNEILASIPDRIELTKRDILNWRNMDFNWRHGYELSIISVLYRITGQYTHSQLRPISERFVFEVSPDFSLDPHGEMTGSITLIKRVHQIDENTLLSIGIQAATDKLRSYQWPRKNLKNRLITVLNTLEPNRGTEWAKALQSHSVTESGRKEVVNTLTELITNNKLRIRNTEVIERVGEWIDLYLSGIETGLVNLMQLRIMANRDLPIYSVKEVEDVLASGTSDSDNQ